MKVNIPHADVNHECGGGSQAEQTAAILIAFEKELLKNPSNLVMVVGDVTSTMACTIVAKKLKTKEAHVEGGIRSFDLTMPEEINRMVTDSIFFVGNVMIDTLLANIDKFKKPNFYTQIKLRNGNYFVLTMHRPFNVDKAKGLTTLIHEIALNTGNLLSCSRVIRGQQKFLKNWILQNLT